MEYAVGIYARLSVESDMRKNESIESQIEIAMRYMETQSDMVLYDCYIDLGKSGSDFRRESFERLMQDVRTGRVNCILVKDLSRFGRNYIEVGNYIENIFPFLGVRFIAIADNFDSINELSENDTLGIELKNLVNEMYAKDISLKVKTGKQTIWENCGYVGGNLPYGYKAKWKDGIKCLMTEEVTSGIVKDIYRLFLSGKNLKAIALWLYEKKILRPMQYCKSGHVFWREGDCLLEWSKGTLKAILTNPVYMGCLVRGITGRNIHSIRDKSDFESSDWEIKQNTHSPIVSENDFFAVISKFQGKKESCVKRKSVYIEETRNSKKDIREDLLKIDRMIEMLYKENSDWYIRYRNCNLNQSEFLSIKQENNQRIQMLENQKKNLLNE